jgi:Protein of unknown function (DUF3800)
MWLFYMDESGNTGTRLDDPDQPIFYLAAIAVPEQQVNPLEREFRRIVTTHFGESAWRSTHEIKGQALRKGSAPFNNLSVMQRIELTRQLLLLLAKFDVRIFYAGIDKQDYPITSFNNPHQDALIYLIGDCEEWLEQTANGYGLLIADEQDEIGQTLIENMLLLKRLQTAQGHLLERIVDSIHFVKSSNNPLIQLADLVVFTINRGLRVGEAAKPAYLIDQELLALAQAQVAASGIYGKEKPTKVVEDSGSVTQTRS